MRNILTLTSASMLALGFAFAGPAYAQAASPGLATQGASPTRVQIKHDLNKAGVNDRQNLRGHLAWAQSPSGQSVAFLIRPQNTQGGMAAHFDENKLRSDLTKGGFKNIGFDRTSEMIRGQFLGDRVLAFEGQSGAERANGDVDASKLGDELSQAGLTDSGASPARLFYAPSSNANTWFVLIEPKQSEAHSLTLGDRNINKLDRNGFIDASMYNPNMRVIQGRLGNWDVTAVAGSKIGPAGGAAANG